MNPSKTKERGLLTEVDLLILARFEIATSSSLEPNIEEKAIRFVADLILFDAKESESFVASTWQVLTVVASRTPSSHHGQEVLIRVINMLEHYGPWTDLPGFGISIRDSWNHSMLCGLDRDKKRRLTLDDG